MKKTLLFLIAATAMMMTGCSNDDFGGATQGMTLNATVEQPASRSTMTEETDGTYQFSFTDNDKISVGNTPTSDYYIFTKSGEKFSCATAKPAGSDVDWYAYFPSTTLSLADQKGDLKGVANYYACAGKTAQATTGANGLAISLTPKVAILRIVKVDGNSTTCDINVKTGEKWVSGLTAKSNEAGFDVVTSESKVTLLTASEPRTYYIAVPAGVQIAIYNGGKQLKATKAAGLAAGKYYTVTTGPVRDKAEAIINGKSEMVEWVQLWAGGPKFATKNVATKMTFNDATKTGDAYVWGKNWRTPTKEEMTLVNAQFDGDFYSITPLHTTCQIVEESGVVGLRYTGIMPGYTKQSIFLPLENDEGHLTLSYWTSSSEIKGYGTLLTVIATFQDNVYKIPGYFFHPMGYTTESTSYYVLPVLAE